jgi:hypothetical protein
MEAEADVLSCVNHNLNQKETYSQKLAQRKYIFASVLIMMRIAAQNKWVKHIKGIKTSLLQRS